MRGVPAGKTAGLFTASIATVCSREKRCVPFIITRCVREVERRGVGELGIYRVSGLASDITRLKKSFESSEFGNKNYTFFIIYSILIKKYMILLLK